MTVMVYAIIIILAKLIIILLLDPIIKWSKTLFPYHIYTHRLLIK